GRHLLRGHRAPATRARCRRGAQAALAGAPQAVRLGSLPRAAAPLSWAPHALRRDEPAGAVPRRALHGVRQGPQRPGARLDPVRGGHRVTDAGPLLLGSTAGAAAGALEASRPAPEDNVVERVLAVA